MEAFYFNVQNIFSANLVKGLVGENDGNEYCKTLLSEPCYVAYQC